MTSLGDRTVYDSEVFRISTKRHMKRIIFMCLLIVFTLHLRAEMICDSVKIYFPVARHYLDLRIPANERALSDIVDRLHARQNDSVLRLRKVLVIGAASPEGGIEYNKELSRHRAETLFRFIKMHSTVPDSLLKFRFLGRDWPGLVTLVERDPKVPFHSETLDLLNRMVREADLGMQTNGDQVTQVKQFKRGIPYGYMYRNLFPELRQSNVLLWYERVPAPDVLQKPVTQPTLPEITEQLPTEPEQPDTVTIECKPFYMDINTNMLYDAATVPNIGVEFYLGKNLSIDANWMYGWWSSNRRHRYWRVYGGDLELRWWFGKEAHQKPLTGHHLGAYFQTLTYDFEFGGKGYMGGQPGGSLWDRACFGGGFSYGYSLPIARRLNIDFEIGIGYLGGRYYEYVPRDGCYVWQATKHLNYFGPTKLEVSLVWLIGCDNYNRPKSKETKITNESAGL